MSNAKTDPEYDPIIGDIAAISRDTYYEFVFRHPMDYFRERVAMAGGGGHGRVLDLGQGYGQWSIALAETNDSVTGVDHSDPMCATARFLADHYRRPNIEIIKASAYDLEKLFEPQSFDFVWCWSVIMFCDRARVMPAVNRLLKDGGMALLGSVNTPTRWAYKAAKGRRDGLENENFYKFCAAGENGLDSETGVNAFSADPGVTRGIVERYGFDLVALDYDGRMDIEDKGRIRPFETLDSLADENVELLIRKSRAV